MNATPTVADRVKVILADVIGLSGPIHSEDNIYKNLAADSLDLVEICVEIHSEFDFEVEADAADKWRTVGDIVRYVCSKLPVAFTQDDVDSIVARAKELGAGPGLAFKMGQFQLSNYSEPHGSHVLAQVIVGAWDEKWDLIHATQALIEFLSKENAS